MRGIIAFQMDESAEQKWNRVQKKIQHVLLTAYPNPDRQGCPGEEGLSGLAERATSDASLEGDAVWEHVKRCSPCYREFLAIRERLRELDQSTDGARGADA